MHTMLVTELDIDPARLVRVLHYDGTPITARFIANAIRKSVQPPAPRAADQSSQKELA
jgi:2-oxoglutarate ferredoxin oxidoreductase subunit alpha